MRIAFSFLFYLLSLSASWGAADIAAGAAKAKVMCVACHASQATGTNPLWPKIAGQHASYTIVQMQAFKVGKLRRNPLMSAVMSQLSNEDIDNLASYFSQLPVVRTPSAKVSDTSSIDRGQQLYQLGNLRKGIAACIACHGPDGRGNAQAGFPLLAGQFAPYLVAQLKVYQTGERQTGINRIMPMIAARLSEQEMVDVAAYITRMQ